MNAVTLAEVKAHLNVTTTDDDALIQSKLDAAEAHIGNLLGFEAAIAFGSPEEVPADLREATLQLVGHFYENREATLVGVSAEEIPFGVWQLIAPYREYVF